MQKEDLPARKAVENLRKYTGVKVVIHHIISDNASVDEFIRLAKDYGSDLHYHVLLPLMKHGRAQEQMTDEARTYFNTSGDGVYLKVYYSTDRRNWTLAKNISSTEMSSTRAVSYTYTFGELSTFVIDNIPAGDYYIGFAAGYSCIDNIYGFQKLDVAHDLVLKEQKIPAKGMVNNTYTASITLDNLNALAEAADSYEVALYVNGEKVSEAVEKPEIAVAGTATFEFSMTPHEVGTFPVYIEFKSLADGFTLKSDAVDVTVSEETASKDIVVGEALKQDYSVPFYFFNADNALGADTDILYPADMLKNFGLSAGQKISYITYTGTPLNFTMLKSVLLNLMSKFPTLKKRARP